MLIMLLTIYYRNMLLLICCRSRSIQDLTMCGVFLNVKLFHDDLKLCPVDSIVSYDHKVFLVFRLYLQKDNTWYFAGFTAGSWAVHAVCVVL